MFYDRRASGVFGSHWTSGRAPRATTSPASLLQSALPLLDAAAEMKKEGNSYSPKIHRSWQIFGGFCGLYHWFSRLALIFIHPVMKAMAQVGFEGSALLTQAEARLRLQSKWASSFTVAFSQGKWRDMNEKDRLLLFFSFSVCCLDALLGFFLMLLLHLHWDHLLLYLTSLRHWAYSQQLAAHLVPWLMGAPADFKLNHELTSFAGSLFLSMFSLWDVQLPPDLLEALAVSARIFACFCAMMGGSMAVALVMDVLAITSLPLFVAYVGTCLCWRMATRSLYSLCLLFQGWKYNILRSRVDHHNFSLDQLLIGVILLSIVVFLLPSLFMFYTCFTAAWLLVLIIHGLLGLLVVLCNSQPICLLFLFFQAPWHHGASLEMTRLTQAEAVPPVPPVHPVPSVPHLYLRLSLRPAKVLDIFQPLATAWRSYLQNWMPKSCLKRLVCGQVWPIRSPIAVEMTLPRAKSLES